MGFKIKHNANKRGEPEHESRTEAIKEVVRLVLTYQKPKETNIKVMFFRNLDAFGSHHQYSAKPALVPFSLFLQKRILNQWLQNHSACATILASTMDAHPHIFPLSGLQTQAFQHPFLALGSRYIEAFAPSKMC